jgi:hypothetical protein
VRAVVGLQGQDAGAASLGVRARLAGSTASAVDGARFVERSVVRVPCMRGTLHLVAVEDARWLVALLGPIGLARNRRRIAQMGADGDDALRAVRDALGERGPLTRAELVDEARGRGVRLSDDPQAGAHLVGRAMFEGLVCEAAPRDGKAAYALVDDWLGPDATPFDRDVALAELARRYVAAHPPAAPEDLAAWSGLGVGDARRAFAAIEAELDAVTVLDRSAFVPRGARPGSEAVVRLLPAFDGLLLAHRDRRLTVAPEHARDVLPGGGVLRPTLLVDGRVEGTWRIERGRPTVTPFSDPREDVADVIAAECDDVVRHRAGEPR